MPKYILIAIITITTFFLIKPQHSINCDYNITSIPVVIKSPGRWCLANNIDASKFPNDAIRINSDHVILDGQGFNLIGPKTLQTVSRGIIAYDRNNVTVKNIHINGYHTGILFADTTIQQKPYKASSKNIIIKNVLIENSTLQGIHLRGFNFIIKDSRVMGVGPTSTTPHAFATGIYAVGNSCLIEHNAIKLGQPTGNGENVGIALYLGSGCHIANNNIAFDRWPQWGRNYGIWTKSSTGESPLVENNIIHGASYALGPWGLFKNNIASNLSCELFVTRKNDINNKIDLGGNIATYWIPGRDPVQGSGTCPDNEHYAQSRYYSNLNQHSAYAAAMASGEGGADTLVETYAWFLVAAHYNHVIANNVVKSPGGSYTPEIIRSAKLLSDKILNTNKGKKSHHRSA